MEDLSVAEHPGMHRYSQPHGLPALLDALVERERERTGVPTERGNVLLTAGATGGLGAIVGALLDPGEKILILAPHWPLVAGIARSFHGEAVQVPFFGVADSAESAVEVVEAARDERTVAVYWNTPSNPTGRLVPRPWLEALTEWARRHDLWILADEVYEDYVFDGEHPYTRPLAPERTFACHSFSKALGMAGNRCGWVVGPREAIEEVKKVSTHTFYCAPTAAQIAGLRALDGRGEPWIAEARELYAEVGRSTARRLGLPEPGGSTFLFFDAAPYFDEADVAAGSGPEAGLAGFLERAVDRGLFLAPGASFGPYPTHVRLCYTAAPPEVTARGVEVLAELMGR